MKAKIYFTIILLFAGISVVQAQIKGKVLSGTKEIKTIKENGYDKIIGNYSFFIEEAGNPELPVVLKSYLIPMDADNIIIDINSVSKQKIAGEYTIFPAQPPQTTNNKQYTLFVQPNQKIYDSDIQFPNKVPEIITDEFYLGYRIVTIRLYPFEYIPKRKELYACDIDFSINYTLTKSSQKKNIVTQYQTLYRQELNKKAIRFRVENPEDVDKYNTKVENIVDGKNVILNSTTIVNNNSGLRSAHSISVLDERIPEYIIITADSLTNAFRPLANWKIKKGIYTIIQSVENIAANYQGSDLAEQIRNYIIDAKSKCGNGLFILLGGGINIIPPRMIYGIHDPADKAHETRLYPTDMYYATFINSWNANNNDKFNEYQHNYNSITGTYQGATNIDLADYSLGVILGRIPVENITHTSIWVNKVISYEKATNISNLDYFKNNLYSDAYMGYDNSTGKLNSFAISSIKSYITNFVPNGINNKYICDNADCTGNSSTSKYGTYCPEGDIELNRANFLSCLSTGANLGLGKFHFIYHMDHCGPIIMGTSSIDKGQSINRTDMDNLTNGTSYQIMMSSGCHPANFEYDCIGEHYLINPNGGGVAFLGNTDSGWTNEYNQLQYFLDALYSKTGHLLGRYDIGSIYQYSLSGSSTTKWRLHLLGDPEMQVWTDLPQTLNTQITSPTAIMTDQQNVTVSVSGLTTDSARICLWKGLEVYETRTVSNGTYSFTVTPETAGTMYVTTTAHNYFPKEDSITVNTSTAPNIFIQSINFIDNGTHNSTGNNNGQNDAGETVCMQITLKNNGINTATGLTATLSCNSDSVDITNTTASAGNLASGDSTIAQFLYHIDKDMHETLSNSLNPVTFQLQIASSSGLSWTKDFNIDVFATDLIQRNKIITNSTSSSFDFQIELQNTGKAPSSGLSGYLYFNNDSIAATFPGINSMETKLSNTFHIPLPLASNPNFTLKVKNTFGKTWTSTFNLTKPATVSGLDFTAAEKSISLTWNTVSSAGGYNIYRCDVDSAENELGNYIKLNSAPVTFSFYSDASGLSTVTKYYYKVAAVSPTGMEGNTSGTLAWTSLKSKYLFPVTMSSDGMGRGVNVADVNGDGYQEIFIASKRGFLAGLDHEGSELYDIDNNVTTYSGFIDLGIKIWGKPVIGDLNGDGAYQIVEPSITADATQSNKLFIISAKDEDQDGKPDIISQAETNPPTSQASVSAILANIDNSPDRSMEIIVSYKSGLVVIYNADGTVRNSSMYAVGNESGAIAVADLDNDGYMEIIKTSGTGIYIWKHDGSNFNSNSQPVYTLNAPDFQFKSSVTVCDIDNDGQKEILAIAVKQTSPYEERMYAVKTNGALVQNWALPTFSHNEKSSAPYFSVGDMDGDGNLEIVVAGGGHIRIYDNYGNLHRDIQIPNYQAYGEPILADIDGDSDIELIANSSTSKFIYAYKKNGDKVLGFPIAINDISHNSVCVSDVDNDGKNELIAATPSTVYMWATEGSPLRIEAGTSRQNTYNTGEYKAFCLPVTITSDAVWNEHQSICGDIIIQSGKLTVSSGAMVTMQNSSRIIVQSGGELEIDGGEILNVDIEAFPGSKISMKNNAYLKLSKKGKFNIQAGAIFNYQQGKIDRTENVP